MQDLTVTASLGASNESDGSHLWTLSQSHETHTSPGYSLAWPQAKPAHWKWFRKPLFIGLALGQHQLHFSMRLKHGELSGCFTSSLQDCAQGGCWGDSFGGISCICMYLCISFRAVPQQKTRPFWNRDPSCSPHHCSVLCSIKSVK